MADVSRRPSPVTRAPTRAWGSVVLAAVLVAAGSLLGGVAGSVRAADDPQSVLDRPIIDVAFVDRGPGLTPDLLTLALDETTLGRPQLALLRRDPTWVVDTEVPVTLPGVYDGGNPWLVQLGATSFAMIASAADGSTLVARIRVDTSGSGAVIVDPATQLGLAASDAGVADATGDGVADLILSGPVGSATTDCPPIGVAVVSGKDSATAFLQSLKLPRLTNNLRLAGAALGEWDGRPGIDLLANTYETCPSLPDYGEPHHLVVIRLRDGAVVVDRATSPSEMATTGPWPSQPVVLDLDADGRNEALIATNSGLRIVDPADGWRSVPIAGPRAAVLAVRPSPDGRPGTSVTWVKSTDDGIADQVGVARITKVGGVIGVDGRILGPLPGVPTTETHDIAVRIENVAMSQQPTSALLADIDGDGCADIVAPLAWIGCETPEMRRGPSWLDTRPLGLVGDAGDRRVLVAAALDWYPYPGGPQAPTPAAASPPGAWRSVSGQRFVLAEVPVATVTSGSDAVVGVPEIRRTASKDGVVEFGWPAGTRLLVRATPMASSVPSQDSTAIAGRHGFLYENTVDGEFAGMILPGAPGTNGATPSSQPDQFDLRGSVLAPDGVVVDRWIVTAAALDASGSISDPVQATAVVDLAPPALRLVAPPLSPPWPFAATLHGTTEVGSSVSLPGASPVVAGFDGSFALPAQFAPWPQTFEVTAVDAAGNATVEQVSVMGGADLQGLPWPAIGALIVLLGAGLSSMRGVRRRRPASGPARPAAALDADHGAVIEELSSGRIRSGD